MNYADKITDKNSTLFEDIIINDKVKDGNTSELIRLVCNTANNEVATNFAKENFDKFSYYYSIFFLAKVNTIHKNVI